MSRILYFTTVYDRPVGGVRTIFRHVEELRGMGFDAYVVSNDTNEPPTWFETTAPILSMKPTLGIMADDVFVYPEVGASFLEATAKLTRRRVVFVQNQDGLFEGIKDYPNWEAAGVEHALYCSRYVAGIAERMFRFKSSQVVRCVVDRAKFKPGPKRSRVVTMPRKRQRDLPVIRQAFEHMWPQYARLPWFTLHGVGEDVVASHMSEAAVFLSLSWREGLGLPPLEAMASGALVAGFTGLGGREYASRDNGLWVAEDDLFAAADAVGQALRLTLEEPDKAAAMRQAGFATADHYSAEGMRQDLRSFWENFLRG